MEYILTDIWKGHMCNAKLLKTMPGKGKALKRLRHKPLFSDYSSLGSFLSVDECLLSSYP